MWECPVMTAGLPANWPPRNELDVYMIRYNAAHRGAEHDIFPHLAAYNPGVVSYTADPLGISYPAK